LWKGLSKLETFASVHTHTPTSSPEQSETLPKLDLNDTVPLKSAEVLYGASAGGKTLTTKLPSVLYATGETEVSFHPSYFTSVYIPTVAPPTDSDVRTYPTHRQTAGRSR